MLPRLPGKTKLWFNFLAHWYFLPHLLLMVICPNSFLIILLRRKMPTSLITSAALSMVNPALKTNLQLSLNGFELCRFEQMQNHALEYLEKRSFFPSRCCSAGPQWRGLLSCIQFSPTHQCDYPPLGYPTRYQNLSRMRTRFLSYHILRTFSIQDISYTPIERKHLKMGIYILLFQSIQKKTSCLGVWCFFCFFH